jgi:acyl-ACP dehydrogenase
MSARPTPTAAGGGDAAATDAVAIDAAARVRAAVAAIRPLVADAERERRFPRAAVERLAAAGILRERWEADDARVGALLAEELARAGAGGVGLGVTVHVEAGLSILLRHATTPLLRRAADAALRGDRLLAIAASEAGGGSDPSAVETELVVDGDELRVRGTKRYVSLGLSADDVLVTCRTAGRAGPPQLSLVLVPRDQLRVQKRLETVGVRGIETVRLTIDARVPRAALVGRLGAGMVALNRGLTHERLATAAITLGTAELAVGLAAAHLGRRRTGGQPLVARQAPRLLLAEHAASLAVVRRAVHSLAAEPLDAPRAMREVAGLKVTAARLGERVVSDCMHLFGGLGYLEDEAPLARLWRDVRAARIGGGTDEMMWELVAGGLVGDEEAYRTMVDDAR